MPTPWMHMLASIVPDINVLTKIMIEGPAIHVRTVPRPVGLDIVIIDESAGLLNFDATKLTEIVDWSATQLEGWKGCNRVSWDTWYFNNKAVYNKFMTLYHLRWQA